VKLVTESKEITFDPERDTEGGGEWLSHLCIDIFDMWGEIESKK